MIQAIILFPLMLYLPGLVAYRVFWHGRRWLWRGSLAEAAFVQFLIGALYAGMTGLILAQLGRFSLLTMLAATVLPSIILIAMRRDCFIMPSLPRRSASNGQQGRINPAPTQAQAIPLASKLKTQNSKLKTYGEMAALIALLILAVILFARPAETIRGAADAGVYSNSGAHIAQHGGIIIKDPLIRHMTDEEIRQYFVGLNPDRYTLTRQRASGFYIYDKEATLVVPQHYTLYSVWLAIFFVVAGGVAGEMYATAYLMLLALFAVYFAGKRMFGAVPAYLGVLLLALNTTEVWFARYSVAEAGTQFLGFAAFYCFAVFVSSQRRLDNIAFSSRGAIYPTPAPAISDAAGTQLDAPSPTAQAAEIAAQTTVARAFAVLAALSLGEIFFIRPDFVFYLLPVPLYLAWLLLARRWRPIHWWLFLPLLGMLLLGIVHIFFFTYPYTFDLFHNVLIDQRRLWVRNLALLYGGATLFVVLWLLLRSQPRWLRPLNGLASQYWPRVRLLLLALLALGAGFYMVNAYIIKPHIITLGNLGSMISHPANLTAYIGAPVPFDPTKSPTDNSQAVYNMVKVGWYFSPLGIALATLGMMLALWRKLTLKSAFFFLMLAISLFVFVGETYSDPHYIYTMRRYIPIITPAFSLFMGYFCFALFSWGRTLAHARGWRLSLGFAAQLGVAALYLIEIAFFVYTIRPIFGETEDQGTIAQIGALAQKLPANSVTIMSADRDTPYVALTPLRFIYDRDVLALAPDYSATTVQLNNSIVAGSIAGWLKDNRPVYAMLGANGGKLNLPGYDLKPIEEWTYTTQELEQLYYQKPLNIATGSLHYGLYQILPRTVTPTLQLPLNIDMGGDFDYPYTVSGWFDKEQDTNGATYRWTGPDATLRLPAPTTPTTLTITMRVSAGPPQRCSTGANRTAPDQVGLYNGNTPVMLANLPLTCQPPTSDGKPQPGIFTEVRGQISVTTPPADGWLYLTLNATAWQPATDTPGADARRLGVQVDSITVGR